MNTHIRSFYFFSDRNIHLKILVSTVNATTLPKDSAIFTTCGQYIGHSGDGNVITIQCPVGTSGRWVRIQDVNPTLENFHMCEVEVYGFWFLLYLEIWV